ncbi:protein of unknown function [Methylocella tundrae]|uniref:Uncharacterized protein n=1 Tax=Methylocella tundrae TaxID=227605 RepID=A0A4U8Z0G3_METTU|nr:protein of unknown function [Methylocella tundrae]
MERGLAGAYFSVGVRGILSEASSDKDQFQRKPRSRGVLPPAILRVRARCRRRHGSVGRKRLIIGSIGAGYLFDLHKRLDALLVN